MRFRATSDGTVAVYDETTAGDAPFTDPLSNMTHVRFHSALTYPSIIGVQTGTLSLPSRSASTDTLAQHTLFAHGRAGTPLVFGWITAGGVKVGLAGSVPIEMEAHGWGRWLSLGANATNVIIAENAFAGYYSGFSAVSVSWTVYLTDVLL